MQLSSLLGHSAELVRIIRKSPQPGDTIASEYFRSKKYLGSTDRRFISGLVFHTLRTLSLSEAIATHLGLEDVVHGAHLLMDNSENVDLSFINDLPLHVQVNTQDWLLTSTQRRWPTDAAEVWRAMMQSAPLVLRVNLRRATREAIIKHLTAEGIECTAGPLSPAAIVVHQRVNLQQHPLYLGGMVEVQDEGSQLVAYACAPAETDHILDACAGAGGKSLHLADLQNDKGRITAHDIEWNRLKEVPTRANRAGIRSVWASVDEKRPTRRSSKDIAHYDIVLIDAPCSGMGTVRRLPMVKWRLTPQTLERHAKKQLSVLEQYAPHVREGGILVYATCSILPEENENVVAAFLQAHPEFVPDPLPAGVIPSGVEGKNREMDETSSGHSVISSFSFQADPFHYGTDGLFMARMRRIANTEQRTQNSE